MIIVLASRHDEAARSLAARWERLGAALLTPADLSVPGWCYRAPGFESGTAVAGGRVVPNHRITGVLTRLPYVYQQELDHVATEDSAYAASEMNAFLLAWLSALSCPVLNRPSPECLCGPGWRIERWVRLAARLGIPVHPVHRDSKNSSGADSTDSGAAVTVAVTIIGERCFGSVDPSLAGHARRLAAAAGVDLLEVRFTGTDRGSRLVSVNLCPDLSVPEVADAVLGCFGETVAC